MPKYLHENNVGKPFLFREFDAKIQSFIMALGTTVQLLVGGLKMQQPKH